MEFTVKPALVLRGEEELRQAILQPEWENLPGLGKWHVQSDWLCALIAEIKATGQYPYNSVVQREAEARLGLSRYPDSSSPLSTLIYNAQGFLSNDTLREAGYVPLTEDLLEEAFRTRQEMVTPTGTRMVAREVSGKRYAMEPQRRKYAVLVSGQPVRLVAPEKKRRPTPPVSAPALF